MPKNAPLGMVGTVLLAFSILMLFFIILSGYNQTTPLNKTYFLQAETDGITGARSVTQWTYFYVCGEDNKNCSSAKPAYAFGRAWSSNPSNAPSALVGSHGDHTTSFKYYYMWRFAWVFILIALVFEVVAFLSSFLACCGRLGSAISAFVTAVAVFFYALAAAMTTATFVLAHNEFTKDGRKAKYNSYSLGFLWGGFVGALLALALFGAGMRSDKGPSSSRGPFWRRKSTRSYDGRRVKDDYS